MKIDRPLWAAGALLSPQQFQQQARWEAWTNESLANLSLVHPWGVLGVAFDSEALRLGKLKATQMRVRMPDGTLVDTDNVEWARRHWSRALHHASPKAMSPTASNWSAYARLIWVFCKLVPA